jgi:hypothetical protein
MLLLNAGEIGPDYFDDGSPRGHDLRPDHESAWTTTASHTGPWVSQQLLRYQTPAQARAGLDATLRAQLSRPELQPVELRPAARPPGSRLLRTLTRSKSDGRELVVIDAYAVKGRYVALAEPYGDKGTAREPAPDLAVRLLEQLLAKLPT